MDWGHVISAIIGAVVGAMVKAVFDLSKDAKARRRAAADRVKEHFAVIFNPYTLASVKAQDVQTMRQDWAPKAMLLDFDDKTVGQKLDGIVDGYISTLSEFIQQKIDATLATERRRRAWQEAIEILERYVG
jgi:archaellum component FlaG (FlaF/FlaG flagellin family)